MGVKPWNRSRFSSIQLHYFCRNNLGHGGKGSSTFVLSLHCLSFVMKAHKRFIFKRVDQFWHNLGHDQLLEVCCPKRQGP
jgi:hypothetical protein